MSAHAQYLAEMAMARPVTESEFKPCSCGRVHSLADWARLPFHGVQLTADSEGFYLCEMRHCHCGSTVAVEWRRPG